MDSENSKMEDVNFRPLSSTPEKLHSKKKPGKKSKRNDIFDSQISKSVLFNSRLLNSTNCLHKNESFSQSQSDAATNEKLSGKIRCSICSVVFDNFLDQRAHYKTDWHVYNVKRRLLSKETVDENTFNENELILDSSDSQSDEESDCGDLDDDGEDKKHNGKEKSSKIHFLSSDDKVVSIYKVILESSKEYCRNCILFEDSLKKVSNDKCWLILMFSGGHFAAAVFHKLEVIEHKAIHRYTVRAKRGTSQSTRDAKQHGKTPRSAGATIRRQNEATLVVEIQDLLRKWKEHVDHSEKIFIKWPQNSRSILFGGKSPILDKSDARLRKIPFMTGKPTFGELKRIHFELASVRIQDISSKRQDYATEQNSRSNQMDLIENLRTELSFSINSVN